MASTTRPNQLTLRAYQVGFGDCFLLTFHYPAQGTKAAFERHVLIDFGSTGAPKNFGPNLLDRVALDIQQECGGKLHVVVATHRHKDHINGFARTDDGKGPGAIIRACEPEIVLQPWTEDPDAEPNATTPTKKLPASKAYLRALTNMHAFSASMLREIQGLRGAISKRLHDQLSFLGEDNLKNASAVKNLMTMGKRKPIYAYFGTQLSLSSLLPGIRVHVLGPPTLEQSEEIKQQRAKDEAEFWHFQARAAKQFVATGKAAFRGAVKHSFPPYTRWIIPRLQASRAEQLLELVRILDDAMNNTSLILLFEAGGKKLLFPGDAQIENWSFALEQAKQRPKLKKLLEEVDLYKVGHHGSLNATPKSLWEQFEHRGPQNAPQRLQSIVSTMAHKHGHEDKGTEVPRKKLVDALKEKTQFFSTQDLKKKTELKKVFTIPL